MTTSCGIHIDQRHLHLVALDGGPRKYRVTLELTRELPASEDPAATIAETLRAIVSEHKLRPESVTLAIDSGQAAFRNVALPFDDRDKIEEVIKYEVESDFPQWNIEDVIVEFLVLSTKPGAESNLLVMGVPKPALERQLQACEKGGLEAQEAELDGTALFTAGQASGLLTDDAAQLLVHIGDASTTVVLVDGGKLVSMRSIRAGLQPSAPTPEGEADATPEKSAEDEAHAAERLADTARRIRRELARTISSADATRPIAAIHVCGHALPGLEQDTVLEVPLLPWPPIPGSGPGSDGEEAGAGRNHAIACGAALRGLGAATLQTNLRRENLKYAGRFERLELPLAVVSLLVCTLLAVLWIVTEKQIDWRDEGDLATGGGDLQLWLRQSNLFLLSDPARGSVGRLKDPPPALAKYMKDAEAGKDEGRTKFQELTYIRACLTDEVGKLKAELGQVGDIKQPQSALRAATLVMGVIDEHGSDMGRYAVRSLEANYQYGNTRQPDSVEVRMDVDFFAADDLEASRHYNAFRKAILAQPWCVEMPDRPTKAFESGKGLGVEGISVQVNLEKVPEE